ncbi:hypothetical protein VNI00_007215 [Paramarasmius palmivorus]|uniref:F-box domain-containing protein n=1 Tax=Paramarasmius palmivorus TaxID=297713 RepID=A0AAW0D0C1_9AGAR
MFSLRTNHSNAAMASRPYCPSFVDIQLTLPQHNSSNRDYLMSPISKLPVEVLSSIFLQTRDLELESKPKPSPYFPALDPLNPLNCHATPWILSNVSHRWRAIAETTPSLWRLLNVEITDELDRVLNSSRTKEGVPEIVAQRMIERVKRWIENALPKHDSNYLLSGDGPGLLQVSYRNSGWFIRRWDLLLWESSLFPYAQAIARLDVSAHYNLFPLLDGLKGRVARLEALKFDVQGMNQTYRLRLDAFAGSRLRSVEINGVSRFWETIALPWEQMAECNISETSITDSLNVFSLAPNLERFAVRTVGIKNDGPFR